jgi:hypothetical protein
MSPWTRRKILILVPVAAILLFFAWEFGFHGWWMMHSDKYSEPHRLGKTSQQVVAELGPPSHDPRVRSSPGCLRSGPARPPTARSTSATSAAGRSA